MKRTFTKQPNSCSIISSDSSNNPSMYVDSDVPKDIPQYTDKEIREFVFSKLLKNIPDYELRTVIGRALSNAYSSIDWQAMYQDIVYYMPEYTHGLYRRD